MTMNTYQSSIIRNAQWFMDREDKKGFIRCPADEYYGIPGDASLIGHAISIRIYAWFLTKNPKFLASAERSARWLAERQDPQGGWHAHAGYALDAAQCVMEGFYTYERFTGDRQFHPVLVRAADRMIKGTIGPEGNLLIGNLIECGEYAHFCFLAWRLSGQERHRLGGEAILKVIMDHFDDGEGFWDTAVPPRLKPILEHLKPILNPLLRMGVHSLNLKGKWVARISEYLLPLVMKGHGPQYALGMMSAECLLDALGGDLKFPRLYEQTEQAIQWVEQNCAGPVEGILVESKRVPKGEEIYPLKAINDTEHASLWPTAVYLLALVGMNDQARYGDRARKVADWIVSMQDKEGGFWTHQKSDGTLFGEKYGNINFYASTSLWYYSRVYGLSP